LSFWAQGLPVQGWPQAPQIGSDELARSAFNVRPGAWRPAQTLSLRNQVSSGPLTTLCTAKNSEAMSLCQNINQDMGDLCPLTATQRRLYDAHVLMYWSRAMKAKNLITAHYVDDSAGIERKT